VRRSGVAEMRASFAKLERERAFWDEHRREFRRLYPDQFVAVCAEAVVAHACNLADLFTELERNGLCRADVRVQFFSGEPRDHLLNADLSVPAS